MRMYHVSLGTLIATLIFSTMASVAKEQPVDFASQVQPILAKHCISCHGPGKSEGGLSFADRRAALRELDSGAFAIVAGQHQQSALLQRVASSDVADRMPPEGEPLSEEQVAILQRWIEQGAPWPLHWGFRAPKNVAPPQVEDVEWNAHPIDAFVYARLADAGLKPNPAADRRTLIRRATYDLLGLPPTPAEVDAFVADTSPDAYARLVDRLLDSPHYGERWGRHWLDLVRYGESNSYERDAAKPNAWKYRDYVIRSLNEDKPFDQFLVEQLAGDQVDQVTHETLTATGFYRIGAWDDAPPDRLKARYDEWDDVLTTVGQVFLGVTIDCARCHAHKIDPITQADYYRLLAYFADIPPYGRSENIETDVSSPELRDAFQNLVDLRETLESQIHQIEQRGIEKMPAADQKAAEGRGRRDVLKKLKDFVTKNEWSLREELLKPKREIDHQIRNFPERDTILSVARVDPNPMQIHVLARGNPEAPLQAVEPGLPNLLVVDEQSEQAKPRGRLGLARWIASPRNPMTARVFANRIWQYHFGRGIVRSSNNFGLMGTPPTHPELLNWLAHQLPQTNWKLKSMHRLIMLSRTYRQTSASTPEKLANDPQNELFWRFDLRRLSAEEVRDSMLSVSGSLNPNVYGPSFFEKMSAEVLASQSKPGKGWGESSKTERNRRSVYIHVKRSLLTPLLRAFDFPDADSSCEARFLTLQPSQALSLMNGEFAHEQADKLAKVVFNANGDALSRVQDAIHRVFARQANANESAEGEELLALLINKHSMSELEALNLYCLSLLNRNEFIFLD